MVDRYFGKIRIRNLELIIFIPLIIILFMIIIIRPGMPIYDELYNFSKYWHSIASNSTNALLIAFLITLCGNSTILIVIPYALVIYNLSILNYTLWFWIAIISGFGSTLGEIASYYIGRLLTKSKSVRNSEFGEKFHQLKNSFERNPHTVPWAIFLFALTPLPDDILLIPLGMMEYNFKKTIIPCMLGKSLLCLIICFLGFLVGINGNNIDYYIEENPIAYVLHFFVPSSELDPRSDLMMFVFLLIFIYLFARLNFEKILKYTSKNRRIFYDYILQGKNIHLIQLIEDFNIIKEESFITFFKKFEAKFNNISIKEGLIHFEAIIDKKSAFTQSMEFISFFYDEVVN